MSEAVRSWEQGRVQLGDLFIGDPDLKIADAVKNTRNADLLVAYGAVNRLLANSGWSSAYEADEIEAYQIKRLHISQELARRLERWEHLEALQTMKQRRDQRKVKAAAE